MSPIGITASVSTEDVPPRGKGPRPFLSSLWWPLPCRHRRSWHRRCYCLPRPTFSCPVSVSWERAVKSSCSGRRLLARRQTCRRRCCFHLLPFALPRCMYLVVRKVHLVAKCERAGGSYSYAPASAAWPPHVGDFAAGDAWTVELMSPPRGVMLVYVGKTGSGAGGIADAGRDNAFWPVSCILSARIDRLIALKLHAKFSLVCLPTMSMTATKAQAIASINS